MLDLLLENKASVQDQLFSCLDVLCVAGDELKILDPVYGDEELIKSVLTAVANLSELEGKTEPRQRPGGA